MISLWMCAVVAASAAPAAKPEYVRPPFLERFVHSEKLSAPTTPVADGARELSAADRPFLEAHRPFVADFLSWYAPGKERTREEYRRLLRIQPGDHECAPEFKTLRHALDTVLVFMREAEQANDAVRYDRLLRAGLSFVADTSDDFGCPRYLIAGMISIAMERKLLHELTRHLKARRGTLSAAACRDLLEALARFQARRVPYLDHVKEEWALCRFALLRSMPALARKTREECQRQLSGPVPADAAEAAANARLRAIVRTMETRGSEVGARGVAILDERYTQLVGILTSRDSGRDRFRALQAAQAKVVRALEDTTWEKVTEPDAEAPEVLVNAAAAMHINLALPNLAAGLERVLEVERLRSGLRVILRLLEHRAEHGSFPPGLAALRLRPGERLDVDPVTGRAFRYELRGGEFSLRGDGPLRAGAGKPEDHALW